MKKDGIEQLFEDMHNQLDIYEPSVNHEARFLEKLQQQSKVVVLHPKKTNWYKQIAVAASIAVLLGTIFFTSINPAKEEVDLANISPQMHETQSFFASAIQVQLEEIDEISSPETKILVTDAMKQLEKLESDYQVLKKDLFHSGNDKRVISAMIKNFQQRANLLEDVLDKMNTINDLKLHKNENYIL